MQRTTLRYKADWDTGTYLGSILDTQVAISAYNHPALIPARTIISSAAYTGPQLHAGAYGTLAGTGWATFTSLGAPLVGGLAQGILYTTVPGDTLTFTTTTEVQVVITFAGVVTFGMPFRVGDTGLTFARIRNGAIAYIFVDSVLYAAVDTYQSAPVFTLNLDGAPHTVQIMHYGQWNTGLVPLGPLVAGTGTTIVAGAALSLLTNPPLVSASWRLTATGTSTYRLEKAVPVAPGASLSYSTVASSLATGTLYAGSQVPGVNLQITGPLTNGDSATFITDVTEIGILTLAPGLGDGSHFGAWTSPVFDSGTSGTQWFLAEWEKNPPFVGEAFPAITVTTGNSSDGLSVLDGVPQAPPLAQYSRDDTGLSYATAGLLATAQGQFFQFSIQQSVTGVSPVWIRDLAIYSWVPDPAQEPDLLGRIAWPAGAAPNTLTQAFLGVIGTAAADALAEKTLLASAPSLAKAEDQYLLAHGQDRNFLPISGIDPAAYRTQLQVFDRSHDKGGSPAFLCEQLAILVNDVDATITTSVVGGKVESTGGGVSVVQTGAFALTISIPPPPYLGISTLTVSQAQSALTTFIQTVLRPLGHAIAIVFN